MLRRYTPSQAAEKLALDESEIRFLLLHFREFLSAAPADDSMQMLSDQDLQLMQRVYGLMRQDQTDPISIRALLRSEMHDSRASGPSQGLGLAFVGGRSGSGKSVVIWNLAAALVSRGFRCTVFDGSISGGGVGSILPLKDGGHNQISSWEHRFVSGVRLVLGEQLMACHDEIEAVEARLQEIDTDSDFILIDTGFGRSDNALRFAMVADEIVAVTTPDVGANADCFGIVRMLKEVDPDLRVSVAINRATNLGEAREAFARISGAAGKVGMPELASAGWIADEDAVRQYMEQGLAVAEVLPTSAAARCFGRIADYFAFRLTPAPRRHAGGTRALLETLRLSVKRGGEIASLAER